MSYKKEPKPWVEKLKLLRQKGGYSQNKLAEYCGLDRSSYSYYELGKTAPSLETMVKLARFYGVTVDYLVDGGVHDPENPIAKKQKKTK